jgi:DNA-binding NtrC family response regulator
MPRKKAAILIVEDERNTREGLARLLRAEYDVTIAEDGSRGVNLLKRHNYDIVLTDLKMPGAGGMDVLEEALKKNPRPSVVILTAYGSIEGAVGAMRSGAYDFLSKPINLDQLELVVKRALESRKLAKENKELKKRLDRKFGMENIIGDSLPMRQVLDTVRQIATAKTTVLITGESGTGKELVAQSIHQLSGREGPFVPVHCAALPSNLLESELFGHEKGAFTGAVERRAGRFELANGGTIFLDEIGEIDQQTQVKLLRVLETRTFERVGGVEPITTTARIIAATNKDLRGMIDDGTFREDLFFRLFVVAIHMPPLRDRKEDVQPMLDAFAKEFSAEAGREFQGFSDRAMDILLAYDWPGNVRELRNCVERMVVMSRGPSLQEDSIPVHIREAVAPETLSRPVSLSSLNLEENERALIIKSLEETHGNRTKAAELLGISRRTMHRKLHQYGLS